MIGIIGAMDTEVDNIKAQVKGKTVSEIAGVEFVCGFIEDVTVCVAKCSPGKVNAALCAQAMIDNFDIEMIINVGVACSLSNDVVIKNVVIASDVCEYDIDITALGEPRGFINGLNVIKVKADEKISELLARTAISCGEKIHRGTIASGDTFIASSELKDMLKIEFGAICGEMEGGAIGHTCAAFLLPFCVQSATAEMKIPSLIIPHLKKSPQKSLRRLYLNLLSFKKNNTLYSKTNVL